MTLKPVLQVLIAVGLAGSASAAPAIIDFSTGAAPDPGTLTYAGGATPLIGANLGIGLVRGINTPANAGVTDTVSAVLNFTSGNFVSYNAGTDTYTFAGGGSITITGTAPGCSTVGGCGAHAGDVVAGPLLLTGSVVSATYQDNGVDLNIDLGSDTKDPALMAYFGFTPDITFQFSGTIHAAISSGGGGGAFVADSTASTDIRNQAVPEPAAVLLLGTLLFGITGLIRRQVTVE